LPDGPTDIATRFDLERRLERPRAKSLIVTIYGDAILPRGGRCWLGDLIALVAPLGLNERVTRTAVFRLVQDGILEAERVGRRSRYALTRAGRRQFDSARARIYTDPPTPGSDAWTCVVVPDTVPIGARDALTRELGWLGFARLTAGLLAAARDDAVEEAAAALGDHGLAAVCPIFLSHPTSPDSLPALAARAWPLADLAEDYARFVAAFDPVAADAPADPVESFCLRALLIHHYRRRLLRDPALPDALLPARWPGHRARSLTRALYARLAPDSDAHLDAVLEESRPL
jgi:phenylacetic acid degradation operon negative regulatory protein